jgi:cytochrome c oxidase subunit 3
MKKLMVFFDLISQKPWESAQIKSDNEHIGKTFNLGEKFLGLRTLIVVSGVFFSLFLVAAHHREVGHDWIKIPVPIILWINTIILFLCSVSFFFLTKSVNEKNFQKSKQILKICYFSTFAFIVGQFLAWYQMIMNGNFINSSPGLSFFYLLTAIHIIHLIGGVFFLNRSNKRINSNNFKIADVQTEIKICEWYWHFLLLVWLIIFTFIITH